TRAVRSCNSAEVAESAAPSRPQMATLAPNSASRSAIARPMPRLPPVTNATADDSDACDRVMSYSAMWSRKAGSAFTMRAMRFLLRASNTELCDTHLILHSGYPDFHPALRTRMWMRGHTAYRSMDKYP